MNRYYLHKNIPPGVCDFKMIWGCFCRTQYICWLEKRKGVGGHVSVSKVKLVKCWSNVHNTAYTGGGTPNPYRGGGGRVGSRQPEFLSLT